MGKDSYEYMTFYGASHGIRREGVTTVQFNLEYQETRTNIMKFLIDTLYFEDVPLAGLFNMIGTGMFLSIKEAPVWATTGTFYIPPFGVYGKWCRVFYQPKPAMVPADRKDAGSVHGVVLIKVPREVGSFEVEEKNIESRMH
ncbi:unnamed protein product [Penicillium manginii]